LAGAGCGWLGPTRPVAPSADRGSRRGPGVARSETRHAPTGDGPYPGDRKPVRRDNEYRDLPHANNRELNFGADGRGPSPGPEAALVHARPVVERGPHSEHATLFVGLEDDLGPQFAVVAGATEGVALDVRELAERLARVVRG